MCSAHTAIPGATDGRTDRIHDWGRITEWSEREHLRQLPWAGRRNQGDGAGRRHSSTAGLLREREVSGVGLLDHLDLQPCGAGFQEMWPVWAVLMRAPTMR